GLGILDYRRTSQAASGRQTARLSVDAPEGHTRARSGNPFRFCPGISYLSCLLKAVSEGVLSAGISALQRRVESSLPRAARRVNALFVLTKGGSFFPHRSRSHPMKSTRRQWIKAAPIAAVSAVAAGKASTAQAFEFPSEPLLSFTSMGGN